MSDIKAGDRVRVVREYEDGTGSFDGKSGTITRIDPNDATLPYKVLLDGDSEYEALWVHEVEPLEPALSDDRESLITRAKELLAGTDHTGADVVAMATFLAGDSA